MTHPFREKLIDRIIEIRDACPRDPNDACSDDIGDAMLELFCDRLQWIADQYPAGVFPETADEIARCAAAGITLDGIQAMAIRERLLTEAKRLRGEQS